MFVYQELNQIVPQILMKCYFGNSRFLRFCWNKDRHVSFESYSQHYQSNVCSLEMGSIECHFEIVSFSLIPKKVFNFTSTNISAQKVKIAVIAELGNNQAQCSLFKNL